MMQLPPFNEDIERAVLGACLMDNRVVLDVLSIVKPDDFYILRHNFILDAIARLHERGAVVDLLTVGDELRATGQFEDVGGNGYLAALLATPVDVKQVEGYARRVADYAYRHRLLAAAESIKAQAYDMKTPVDVLRETVLGIVQSADRAERQDEMVAWRDELGRYFDDIEASADLPDGVTGVPTGFYAYDDILDGAQEGSLNLLAARPGMGKSSWLLAVALNVATRFKQPVYVWSGEMPRKQLRERIMAIRSGIPTQRLRRGMRAGGMTAQEWTAFVATMREIGEAPIYLDDAKDMTPRRLEQRVMWLERRVGKLGIIIVDHIGLMRAGVKTQDRNNEIGYISRYLKTHVARVAPVWCASQLNRDLEKRQDKRPQLSDLRDSGNLEQDADTVTFLYRDVVYNEATEFPNGAELAVAKNRHGGLGMVRLYFERAYTRFSDAHTTTIDLRSL